MGTLAGKTRYLDIEVVFQNLADLERSVSELERSLHEIYEEFDTIASTRGCPMCDGFRESGLVA